MQSDVFHKEVWFSGHVQGVGFRIMASRCARSYEVTGTVRNLADGRVLLQAEGAENEVTEFVAEVNRQLDSYIRKREDRDFWGKSCFKDFRIVD